MVKVAVVQPAEAVPVGVGAPGEPVGPGVALAVGTLLGVGPTLGVGVGFGPVPLEVGAGVGVAVGAGVSVALGGSAMQKPGPSSPVMCAQCCFVLQQPVNGASAHGPKSRGWQPSFPGDGVGVGVGS